MSDATKREKEIKVLAFLGTLNSTKQNNQNIRQHKLSPIKAHTGKMLKENASNLDWEKGKCEKALWRWLQKCIFFSFTEEVRRKAEVAV